MHRLWRQSPRSSIDFSTLLAVNFDKALENLFRWTFTFFHHPRKIYLIYIVLVLCGASVTVKLRWIDHHFTFPPRRIFATNFPSSFPLPATKKKVSSLKIDLSRVRIVIAMIHQKHFSNSGEFAAIFLSTGIFSSLAAGGREHCWANNVVGFLKFIYLFLLRAQAIDIHFYKSNKVHIRPITLYASYFVFETRIHLNCIQIIFHKCTWHFYSEKFYGGVSCCGMWLMNPCC